MKNSILFCFLFLGLNSITAQGIGNLLLAGEDASLLTENYLSPAASGLMSGMNSGWYSTAKTHKKLGFDITIGTSMSFMPSSAQTFNFKPDQYNYILVKKLGMESKDHDLPRPMAYNPNLQSTRVLLNFGIYPP